MVQEIVMPGAEGLYYGGSWHASRNGDAVAVTSPGTGEELTRVAFAGTEDVDPIISAADEGFRVWREVPVMERAKILREVAFIIRQHGNELALLDAADSGNPVTEMKPDAMIAAANFDYFAGLITEMKGDTVPVSPGRLNYTVREPLGVVLRVLAFNHPLLFCAGKSASVLAAGNSIILKPAEQAPLAALRMAELVGHLFPAGVLNVVPADRDVTAQMSTHPGVASVGLVGSVAAGRAVMRAASDTIKHVLLELGGKNALIGYPDTAPETLAEAMISGMNFGWCGQSCGSVSRAFVHADIYDAVIERLPEFASRYQPGLPTDEKTTMGAVITPGQLERIERFIDSAQKEGARLLSGGGKPDDPALKGGNFIEPTIFVDVDPSMTIAREEIFGPVLAVIPWRDEEEMLREVNGLPYGLTCSIWTNVLDKALATASKVEAGYVWVNEVSRHFVGAPFGGYKQSGLGREECLSELMSFTQEKNVHVRYA